MLFDTRSVLLASLLALPALLTGTASAAEPERPHLAVSAEGFVEATPDVVVINVTVSHTADSLSAAKRQADEVSNAVIRAANLHGIRDDDLQASKIQAAPEYEWHDGKRVLRGQRITRQFELTLRDTDRYAALIQALADASVTELNGIRMEFSNQEKLEAEALAKAISNARAKARGMAAAFDVRLGQVLRASERGTGAPPAPYEMRADFAKAQAASPGEAALRIGKQRIVRTIDAVFAIEAR
jgi:uncharacterized protein YggE